MAISNPLLGALAAGGLAPGAPTIGTATAGNTQATVAFTAPSWVGKGSGTVTYTATSSPGGFTGTATSSPITVTGLTNGTAYTFTVKATTSYGVTGASSAASNSITPVVPTTYVFGRLYTNTITYSTTGTGSWTIVTTPQDGAFLGYDGTRFVWNGAGTYNYSSNIASGWSGGTASNGGNRYGWAGGGGSVNVQYSTPYISQAGSPPTSWSTASPPRNGDWFSGRYANGRHIATQLNDGTAYSTYGAYSTNRTSWTEFNLGANQNWRGPGYGNGRWIVSPRNSSTYSTSTNNGSSWSTASLPASADYMTNVYGNGKWIMPVMGSTTYYYSTNGTSWTSGTLPISSTGTDGATPTYGGGLYIIPAGGGNYCYSSNGTSWSSAALPNTGNWYYAIVDTDGGVGA